MTIMLIKVKEQGYVDNQEHNLWQLTYRGGEENDVEIRDV